MLQPLLGVAAPPVPALPAAAPPAALPLPPAPPDAGEPPEEAPPEAAPPDVPPPEAAPPDDAPPLVPCAPLAPIAFGGPASGLEHAASRSQPEKRRNPTNRSRIVIASTVERSTKIGNANRPRIA